MQKKIETISIDFDGVIHSYITPYNDIPKDPPIDGAIKWLKELLASEFKVAILSTRNLQKDGPSNIKGWLGANGLTDEELNKIEFWHTKEKAKVYIDDRGYHFKGDNFPSVEDLQAFQPHNKHKRVAVEEFLKSVEGVANAGLSLKDILKHIPKEVLKS